MIEKVIPLMGSGGDSQGDVLQDTLIFKGRTTLKKCYFDDYGFSEGLDFSAVGDAPNGAMEDAGQLKQGLSALLPTP